MLFTYQNQKEWNNTALLFSCYQLAWLPCQRSLFKPTPCETNTASTNGGIHECHCLTTHLMSKFKLLDQLPFCPRGKNRHSIQNPYVYNVEKDQVMWGQTSSITLIAPFFPHYLQKIMLMRYQWSHPFLSTSNLYFFFLCVLHIESPKHHPLWMGANKPKN